MVADIRPLLPSIYAGIAATAEALQMGDCGSIELAGVKSTGRANASVKSFEHSNKCDRHENPAPPPRVEGAADS